MKTYGSKIDYAILFISHKGLACMLNMFVHISFGLFFFLNVLFKIYIVMQANKLFIYLQICKKTKKKNAQCHVDNFIEILNAYLTKF